MINEGTNPLLFLLLTSWSLESKEVDSEKYGWPHYNLIGGFNDESTAS
ncbi:MAG: hypothetical protein MJZ34_16015 [Paludibacteraceae bacterium]|nr:hypothetical protein [Paludibacteraceae bacterium]